MKEAPSLLQLIPDIFFDALAYLLPSSLLFLGMMIIPSSIGAPLVNAYLNLGASFERWMLRKRNSNLHTALGNLRQQ